AKPTKTAKSMKAAKLAAAAEKRNRRSANELDSVGDEVVKLLTSTKRGMRVEEINKALGTNTRQLMRPIQKLLGGGKINKSGERRATTYFAG
ncbi:MAG: DNA-binding protein, partial [Polyangiaceae bacterium]|nr:DNA-binding protein [Polyangiaceae bacterium]